MIDTSNVQTLSDARELHRATFGTETKMRDKMKILRKIQSANGANEKAAEAALARAEVGQSTTKARKGSSEAKVRDAVKKLPEEDARRLLAEVGDLLLEEGELRDEKRGALKALRDQRKERLEARNGAVAEWRENADKLDASAVLARVDKAQRTIESLDRQIDTKKAHYKEEIDRVRAQTKSVLESIRQPSLPGVA